MKRISIFCGSSLGNDPIYSKKAYEVGCYFAKNQIELVYGGAKVGLMGAISNGVIDNNGVAIGVLPQFLDRIEIAQNNLSELIIVETMHDRKNKMNELCNGVILLPGGFGSLEEFFEMLTWAQLGLHQKPIGILNINGFYDSLITLLENMVESAFLKSENQKMLLVSETIEDLVEQMKNYKSPKVGKWISEN